MDAARRSQVAEAGHALLPQLQGGVAAARPRETGVHEGAATRALLVAMLTVCEFGDVDDTTWQRTGTALRGPDGEHAASADALIRDTELFGFLLLAEHCTDTLGLTYTERWRLHADVGAFFARIRGEQVPLSRADVAAGLAAAQAAPDLR